jgi:hypothetical protein
MSEDFYVINDILTERECSGLTIDILAHNWFYCVDKDNQDKSYGTQEEIGNAKGLPGMPIRAWNLYNGLTDYVKKVTGNDNLIPSSMYGRIYRNGAKLYKHTDRPTLDWTLTVPLFCSIQKKWPIKLELPNGEIAEQQNYVGSGILFQARKLPHWREPLECSEYEFSVHLFMHWEEK